MANHTEQCVFAIEGFRGARTRRPCTLTMGANASSACSGAMREIKPNLSKSCPRGGCCCDLFPCETSFEDMGWRIPLGSQARPPAQGHQAAEFPPCCGHNAGPCADRVEIDASPSSTVVDLQWNIV